MLQNAHLETSKTYIASEDLMKTVNIAMTLKKPLLVKGEPGTGKTMLAQAIADALGKKLLTWNIKSTTKAQDGLYTYDVVQRLYDSQFGGEVADVSQYIKYGKIGEAFLSEEQVIMQETKETVKAKHRPIAIITSNAEKELPDAFLRRCIFHYIEFPEFAQMKEIVHAHFGDIDEELMRQAVLTFYNIRRVPNLAKKPSTSELLDWLQALSADGVDPDRIARDIPYSGVLLKKDKDIALMKKSMH